MKINGFTSFKLTICAAALAVGGGLQAQSSDEAGATEEAKVSEKLICKTVRDIRSRARKNKVCMTKKQWIAVARSGNSLARSIVSGAASGKWDVLERDDDAM